MSRDQVAGEKGKRTGNRRKRKEEAFSLSVGRRTFLQSKAEFIAEKEAQRSTLPELLRLKGREEKRVNVFSSESE